MKIHNAATPMRHPNDPPMKVSEPPTKDSAPGVYDCDGDIYSVVQTGKVRQVRWIVKRSVGGPILPKPPLAPLQDEDAFLLKHRRDGEDLKKTRARLITDFQRLNNLVQLDAANEEEVELHAELRAQLFTDYK